MVFIHLPDDLICTRQVFNGLLTSFYCERLSLIFSAQFGVALLHHINGAGGAKA